MFINNFVIWDYIMVLGVTALGTILAYAHDPKLKAVLISIPVPFTLAALAVGAPMDLTNILGLVLLLAYAHLVRWFYQDMKLPILPAIFLSASAYTVSAAILAPILPSAGIYFWVGSLIVLLIGIILYSLPVKISEPGYRSPLPIPIKIIAVLLVVIAVVLLKHWLAGFITLFPMMGVLGSYEARKSMRTICRQMPIIIITFIPMIIVSRLTYGFAGLGASLFLGWLVFLTLFIPLTINNNKI
ncbi:hypothetical protein ACFLZV_07355 [Candidatus Margulisiibacteriota bacterium]